MIQSLYSPAAHEVVNLERDVVLPDPHPVGTTTRILRWFPCRKKNRRGDGRWDDSLKKWSERPCTHKRCRRHWRRYALDKVEEIDARRPNRCHWYHLVLHCCVRLKYKRRFPNLGRFVKKVRGFHPDVWVCAVFHEGRRSDHIDVLLGTDAELDADRVRDAWKAHFPAKTTHRWRGQFCTVKPHDDPAYCTLYQFASRSGKPRINPPWGDIPYRSPYRLYAPKVRTSPPEVRHGLSFDGAIGDESDVAAG